MTDLGAKVRRLRLASQMTQAELAGDQITRNMLSQIETGDAMPSLATVQYLARKLDIPAGYFFAEEEDEFQYRKMQRTLLVAQISKRYAGKRIHRHNNTQ